MNAELADFLNTAAEKAAAQGAICNAIDYGTVARLVTYMGEPRISVTAEDGARIVIAAEPSTGRYYVQGSGGGLPCADLYLTGTAALMARDAMANAR